MHWSLYVIIAGILNAGVNYIYKIHARRDNNIFLFGASYFMAAILLLLYHFFVLHGTTVTLTQPMSLAAIVSMGIGSAICFPLMYTAFAKAGPLSLVDPLWVCLYALVSVICGLLITHEHPSITALIGVLCYVAGAFLIAKGKA